jgi:ribosome biogenesis protein SSF1/2
MGRRKQGRRIKHKTQKETDTTQLADDPNSPRAFVFTKGKVSAPLKALVEDLKHVLSPNTARALRAQKKNKLRDFVGVAGQLNVSFFLIVSSTEKASYLRLVRSPHGPTLTFRLNQYSLASDVAASQRRPFSGGHGIWQAAPMLVISDFDKEVLHQKLSSTLFQNLFPTMVASELQIAACRRVVLLHQRAEDEGGGVELRHYAIKAAPTNVSRGVKKLIRGKKLPSLGRFSDMSDFLLHGGGYSSDSGAETEEEEKVQLPQDYHGRGAKRGTQVGIKLVEIGPRLEMSLIKVQEGLCDGAVLYHSLVEKSEEESAAIAERKQQSVEARAERREQQEDNVARKRATRDEKLERRKRRRRGAADAAAPAEEGAADDADEYADDDGDEDDT